jgi:Na+/melibiose symporter-like transporter
MSRMPFTWAPEPDEKKGKFKPWLLLALTLVVLAFCTTLWVHR